MKNKMYQTQKPKNQKGVISFMLKTDYSKIPNKMHLDAQISYPARIHEDKRRKKPKHKGKIFNDD